MLARREPYEDRRDRLKGGKPGAPAGRILSFRGRGAHGRDPRARGRTQREVEEAPAIEVIASLDEAPAQVRAIDAQGRAGGAQGVPAAFYHAGRVYLIADQLRSDRDVVEMLFHETLGHYGLAGAFGEALHPILRELAVVRAAEVKAKARQYGLDWNNERHRLVAAEEVLAELAQTKPGIGDVNVR